MVNYKNYSYLSRKYVRIFQKSFIQCIKKLFSPSILLTFCWWPYQKNHPVDRNESLCQSDPPHLKYYMLTEMSSVEWFIQNFILLIETKILRQ